MRGEVTDIAYFSQESSPCGITDTVNRSDNFHFLDCNGRTEIREDACDLVKLLHKMKESRDLRGRMSSLARLMEAIEFLAVMIISSALIETFLPLPQRSSTSATTLALEALIKRAEGNSLRNRSMVAVNTLHTDSNSGKILWRILLISFW